MFDSGPTSTVIVTGGASGIGRAVAEAFARQQARVVILGRQEEALRAAAQALSPLVSWQRADVSQREPVASSVAAVVRQHGQIDVLVNAAGCARNFTTEAALDEAERLWDEVADANLKGSFLMAMAVAPHLRRPGGRIINLSSIAAYTGGSRPGSIAYAAAKAGVLGLTYSLARELSPQGITVNAVAPGFVAETGFTGAWPEERVRGIIDQIPAGRGGRPEDIAAAVLYLASPEAAFVTGEVLNVNGGRRFGR